MSLFCSIKTTDCNDRTDFKGFLCYMTFDINLNQRKSVLSVLSVVYFTLFSSQLIEFFNTSKL
jgi:hypothetical protein